MYQQMKAMLTTEPADHDTMQFVCNKVAAASLRSLNLPAVQLSEGHSILTDGMLTPVHMGGTGMENPTSRMCQDLSIGILSGLAHLAPVVWKTFNYDMTNETIEFCTADGKESKVRSLSGLSSAQNSTDTQQKSILTMSDV